MCTVVQETGAFRGAALYPDPDGRQCDRVGHSNSSRTLPFHVSIFTLSYCRIDRFLSGLLYLGSLPDVIFPRLNAIKFIGTAEQDLDFFLHLLARHERPQDTFISACEKCPRTALSCNSGRRTWNHVQRA